MWGRALAGEQAPTAAAAAAAAPPPPPQPPPWQAGRQQQHPYHQQHSALAVVRERHSSGGGGGGGGGGGCGGGGGWGDSSSSSSSSSESWCVAAAVLLQWERTRAPLSQEAKIAATSSGTSGQLHSQQADPASVRFSYGSRMERFEQFRFSVPCTCAFQHSLKGWHGFGCGSVPEKRLQPFQFRFRFLERSLGSDSSSLRFRFSPCEKDSLLARKLPQHLSSHDFRNKEASQNWKSFGPTSRIQNLGQALEALQNQSFECGHAQPESNSSGGSQA